jgi:hypothetical protein
MDTQNRFDLEQRIANWRLSVANTVLTPNDALELENHLRESFTELRSPVLNEDEAWLIATRRLGTVTVLNKEFKKVNTDFAVNKNWLMLLWGALGLLVLQALFINLPTLLYYIKFTKNGSLTNDGFQTSAYYALALAVLIAAVFTVKHHETITRRFNASLALHSSAYAIGGLLLGLFAAFACFLNFSSAVVKTGNYNSAMLQAFSTLVFVFYVMLIMLTAYFTIRYRHPDLSSLQKFGRNISPANALLLGFLAQVPIQFTHGIQIDGVTEGNITIALTIILFLPVGWLLSYSRKAIFNIVAAQLIPLTIFLFGFYVNEAARMIFLSFYLSMLLSLIAGFVTGRLKTNKEVFITN